MGSVRSGYNYLLTFIFCIVFLSSSKAQQLFHRQLEWISDKNPTLFRDAYCLPSNNYLPSYHESFPLHAQLGQARLNGLAYETVDSSFLSGSGLWVSDTINLHTESIINNKQSFISISFVPFRKNKTTGNYERVSRFSIEISETGNVTQGKYKNRTYKSNSVLATGSWYKIAINRTGLHRISYSDLQNAGINPSDINMSNLALFGNGGGMLPEANSIFRYDDLEENAISVVDHNSNNYFDSDDYIVFFAESPHDWRFNKTGRRFHHIYNIYDDNNYYFLTFHPSAGIKKRIQYAGGVTMPADVTFSTFDNYAFYEKDMLNVIKKETKSGKEWFGETFDITTSYNFPFYFPDLNPDSNVYLKTAFAVHSSSSSSFTVQAAGNTFSVPVSAGIEYGASAYKEVAFKTSTPDINVAITYNKSSSTSIGWLNYIELNAVCNLNFLGSQMLFRNKNGTGPGMIAENLLGNAGSNVTIWDVTNPLNPAMIQTTQDGNGLRFSFFNDSIREFIAFNGNDFFAPLSITSVPNQDIHSIASPEMVIVSPDIFLEQAERLANLHRTKDFLNVVVVPLRTVYNEFSSGRQDVSAIRDMMKMFYDRAGTPDDAPKYLLLFGDASYDYKDRIPDNTNFVPAFQSDESLNLNGTYISDDFFGLLDDTEGLSASGILDIGIGRLPVFTTQQATEAVDKIERYITVSDSLLSQGQIPTLADWRNTVCFIADDGDNGEDFIGDAEQLVQSLNAVNQNFTIDKIYCDAYTQVSGTGGQRYPEVTDAINRRVEKGALIINYVGHGGELGWTHERILKNSDINSWQNYYNMPLFVTATCEFSRFDDPERVAAGELVFLNPGGGGLGLYTTTRPTYGTPNVTLTSKFYAAAFKKTDGIYPRLGDAVKASKLNYDPLNERKFSLLGDPAIRLAYPRFEVRTDSVNSREYTPTTDTLKGLSAVTISGSVTDETGDVFSGFDGFVYPVVYDKPTKIISNGNDNTPVKTFYLQKNILYKGKVSVSGGHFSFSFIVPKDIVYQYGIGNISYYAENGLTDANGRDSLVIGGYNIEAPGDETGPDIRLFINDTNFISGNITDENPRLLALLTDSSGMNTTGNGIGHDMIAVLDHETDKPYVLNDYYESAENNYRKGAVLFPFFGLSEGNHNLMLRVWDTYNNSSTASIDFIVSSSAAIALQNLLNYPNPFIEKTRFYFEHNQAGKQLEVTIRIYNINGSPVKTIRQTIENEGYVCNQIEWDGCNDQGDVIGKGLYVYKVSIRNETNGYCEKVQKLIVIK